MAFKCKCGSTRIEEIAEKVVCRREVRGLVHDKDRHGDDFAYLDMDDEIRIDDGFVFFRCFQCEEPLVRPGGEYLDYDDVLALLQADEEKPA